MVISGNWLIILQLQGNALLSAGPVPIALGRDARYITRARGSFLARTGYALSREAVTLSDNGKNQCDERILAGRDTRVSVHARSKVGRSVREPSQRR